MEPNPPTAASLAQYLESIGWKDAAQSLRREAKVAPAEELAAATNKDNGAIRTSPCPSLAAFLSLSFT